MGAGRAVAAYTGEGTQARTIPNRTILSGIVYRLRTGSQWKALPAQFGSESVRRV